MRTRARKWWLRSRTMIFAAVLQGLVVVEAHLGVVRETWGPTSYLVILFIVGAAMQALRAGTKEPVAWRRADCLEGPCEP